MIAQRDNTVGFIGLGMMGLPMATNILKKRHPLVVYDRVRERTALLAAEGATAGASAKDVSERAKIVVLMVDTTSQVHEVLFEKDGLIHGARAGDKVICMSTIDPESTKKFAATLATKGIALLDAPVAGMVKGAREGTLRAFVGGDSADVELCRPALDAMASTVAHMGPVGQGMVMKLINNMLCQLGWVIISEALVLGTKAGLDPKLMVQMIEGATGDSMAFKYMAPKWLARDFDGIRLDITYKDVQNQIDLGRSLGVPMFMASLGHQIYQMARTAGHGNEDGIAIVKIYEQLTGVKLSGVTK